MNMIHIAAGLLLIALGTGNLVYAAKFYDLQVRYRRLEAASINLAAEVIKYVQQVRAAQAQQVVSAMSKFGLGAGNQSQN